MALSSAQTLDDEFRRRLTIGFNNFAHAVDHYVMLIFPTVVIGLEVVYGRPYGELLALGTASFFAFGIFSLPAGWLADRWSRRYMMVVFYIGCGLSCAAAAFVAELHRARDRAVRARRVRLDLSSGRHRDRGCGGDQPRPHARLQRRLRQYRRVARRRHHRGADRVDRLARRVPGAGRGLRRDRDRLFRDGAGRPQTGCRPQRRARRAAWRCGS